MNQQVDRRGISCGGEEQRKNIWGVTAGFYLTELCLPM